MLEFLRIRNLALIQDLEMDFDPGFNVLTGESGAGKSFILRALDFILGERLQSAHVRAGADKASVEAIFHCQGQELVLRRELKASTGRSRAFINNDLSSQAKVQALKPRLIIHTSQHGQQQLLRPQFHTRLLDAHVPEGLNQTRDQCLEDYQGLKNRLDELEDRLNQLEQQRELLEYRHSLIAKVAPRRDEEQELLGRKNELREQVASQQALEQALEILSPASNLGLVEQLSKLQQVCFELTPLGQKFQGYGQQLEECLENIKGLETELRGQPLVLEGDQELEAIESRLWELAQLQRRLNRSLDEICDLDQEIAENLSQIDELRLQRQQLSRGLTDAHQALGQAVSDLNRAREQAAPKLAERLRAELIQLGFSTEVQVEFVFNDHELAPEIFERRARLQWVPNPGQPIQALDQIASGGELSRFLLALVCLQSTRELPTLLFDEVDAGIGGVILKQVGQRLQELARRQQIVLVSHWPQLACLAQRHFQIAKQVMDQETYTTCYQLTSKERHKELARMAGGDEQGLAFAQRLLHTEDE
jgi:DNA repair protein RecN (Recombination protein N)